MLAVGDILLDPLSIFRKKFGVCHGKRKLSVLRQICDNLYSGRRARYLHLMLFNATYSPHTCINFHLRMGDQRFSTKGFAPVVSTSCGSFERMIK